MTAKDSLARAPASGDALRGEAAGAAEAAREFLLRTRRGEHW